MGYHSKLCRQYFRDRNLGIDLPNAEIKENTSIYNRVIIKQKDFVKELKFFIILDWINNEFFIIRKNNLKLRKNCISRSFSLNKLREFSIFFTKKPQILQKFYEKEITFYN